MPDAASARAFVDAYRRAFESLDVERLATRFAFPLLVVADGAEVRVDVLDGPDAWRPTLERIVAAYRLLGVRSASVERLDVAEVTARTAHAVVRWSLVDADGRRIYAFTASYTLVDGADGPRIAAIAHDEGPRLQFALARVRGRPA